MFFVLSGLVDQRGYTGDSGGLARFCDVPVNIIGVDDDEGLKASLSTRDNH